LNRNRESDPANGKSLRQGRPKRDDLSQARWENAARILPPSLIQRGFYSKTSPPPVPVAGLGRVREVDCDLECSNRSRAEQSSVATVFTRAVNKIRVKLAICVRMKHGMSPFQLAPWQLQLS
jgi:hypothetical protein